MRGSYAGVMTHEPCSPESPVPDPDPARRASMALMAAAHPGEIEVCLVALGTLPVADDIRAPDIGLAMVRGRIGGDGKPFNLGEATVSRAAIRLDDGTVGICYRLGRDVSLVRRLAVVDALIQRLETRDRVLSAFIEPLRDHVEARRHRAASETAATRVDFFTLVRGDSTP
jgi:alpha-D-ribose 1-methylphosphonate 5-triphosphate synthase subunit PhnG